METLTCPNPTPAHPSESRTNPAITATATTRMPAATSIVTSSLCPPASQESNASAQSVDSGAALQPYSSRSSIVSSQYTSNTDLTSPSSSVESVAVYDVNAGPRKPQYLRARTPERAIPNWRADDDSALFSPMSITSPVASNGTKRTASGLVKNVPSLPSTPLAPVTGWASEHRPRQHSVSSSTGSRASEIAASLKNRLGYAMAKVQHGWEHKSLHEVEELAAERLTPSRYTASFLDSRRNLASLTHGSANQGHHDRESLDQTSLPPTKRHSAYPPPYLEPSHDPRLTSGRVPQLQPAVDIRPASSYRQIQPALSRRFDPAMSPPRTPVTNPPRRPPTLRTQTQTAEAERDALQALFQLGSPHGSQFPPSHAASVVASNQTSPLTSELSTPRGFEFARPDRSGWVRGAEGGSRPRSREA